jgi:MFS family permease
MTQLSIASALPWRARLGTSAIFFANGFGIGSWAADLPKVKAMLALSDAQLSLALFAMAAAAILSMPFAGVICGRLGGPSAALRYTSVCFGLVLCLPGLAASLAILTGVTFALGAFNGLMEVPMNAHATVVERKWGAAIMSSFHAAWSCGGLVGASLAGLLIAAGVPTPFLFAVAGAVVLAIVSASGPQLGAKEAMTATGQAFAWPERQLIGLCLVALLGMLMEGAMADWSAVYLTSVINLAPALAAGGYAAYAFAMLFGRSFGDYAVRALGRMRIIMFGATIAAVGTFLSVASPSPIGAVAGFCLIGLGLSNLVPTVFSASAAMTSSPALGISMAATIGYAGFLLGPPLIGAVASFAGLRVSFMLLIVALIMIVPLAAASRKFGNERGAK